MIPPVQVPADNESVKRIKIQSNDPHEVVGSADLPRRDRAPAEGLRRSIPT